LLQNKDAVVTLQQHVMVSSAAQSGGATAPTGEAQYQRELAEKKRALLEQQHLLAKAQHQRELAEQERELSQYERQLAETQRQRLLAENDEQEQRELAAQARGHTAECARAEPPARLPPS
jgi:chromosome segregation ATPase